MQRGVRFHLYILWVVEVRDLVLLCLFFCNIYFSMHQYELVQSLPSCGMRTTSGTRVGLTITFSPRKSCIHGFCLWLLGSVHKILHFCVRFLRVSQWPVCFSPPFCTCRFCVTSSFLNFWSNDSWWMRFPGTSWYLVTDTHVARNQKNVGNHWVDA